MNITTTEPKEIKMDDISKEIDQLEEGLPDEELDVTKPIGESGEKTETPAVQEEKIEEVESLAEDIQVDTEPVVIPWMTQLTTLDIVEDVFDRAGLTMILLGESARGMKDFDDPFHYSDDALHVALRLNDKEHFDRTIHGMADAWREEVTYEEGYLEFTKDGIKITVEYVDQSVLPYFNFPDKRLWNLREVALPNPYPAYIGGFDSK